MRLNYPVVFPLNQITYVGENDSPFFTERHGRRFNALSQRYMLPADEEEIRVSPSPLPLDHPPHALPALRAPAQDAAVPVWRKQLRWPCPASTDPPRRTRALPRPRPRYRGWLLVRLSETRTLIPLRHKDHRAIDMADAFPEAEIIGVDLAPIQPRYQSLFP
jgi:hypothetical protein